jgi:hypothetical protein
MGGLELAGGIDREVESAGVVSRGKGHTPGRTTLFNDRPSSAAWFDVCTDPIL